jgi:hypothetical protein
MVVGDPRHGVETLPRLFGVLLLLSAALVTTRTAILTPTTLSPLPSSTINHNKTITTTIITIIIVTLIIIIQVEYQIQQVGGFKELLTAREAMVVDLEKRKKKVRRGKRVSTMTKEST